MKKVSKPIYSYDIYHDDTDKLIKIKDHQLAYVRYLKEFIKTDEYKNIKRNRRITFSLTTLIPIIVSIITLIRIDVYNDGLAVLCIGCIIIMLSIILLFKNSLHSESNDIEGYRNRASKISRELSRQHSASTLSDGDYLSNIGDRSRFTRCTH